MRDLSADNTSATLWWEKFGPKTHGSKSRANWPILPLQTPHPFGVAPAHLFLPISFLSYHKIWLLDLSWEKYFSCPCAFSSCLCQKCLHPLAALCLCIFSLWGQPKAVTKETNVCQARVAWWGQHRGSSHRTCDVILNLTRWRRTTDQSALFSTENQLQDEFPAHPRKMQMFWLQLCAQLRRFIPHQQTGAPSSRTLPLSISSTLHDHSWYFVL